MAEFTDLTDTPGALVADQFVRVNAGATALVFVGAAVPNGAAFPGSPTSGDVFVLNGSGVFFNDGTSWISC